MKSWKVLASSQGGGGPKPGASCADRGDEGCLGNSSLTWTSRSFCDSFLGATCLLLTVVTSRRQAWPIFCMTSLQVGPPHSLLRWGRFCVSLTDQNQRPGVWVPSGRSACGDGDSVCHPSCPPRAGPSRGELLIKGFQN